MPSPALEGTLQIHPRRAPPAPTARTIRSIELPRGWRNRANLPGKRSGPVRRGSRRAPGALAVYWEQEQDLRSLQPRQYPVGERQSGLRQLDKPRSLLPLLSLTGEPRQRIGQRPAGGPPRALD